MITKGCSTPYNHKNVYLEGADVSINLGTVKIFCWEGGVLDYSNAYRHTKAKYTDRDMDWPINAFLRDHFPEATYSGKKMNQLLAEAWADTTPSQNDCKIIL